MSALPHHFVQWFHKGRWTETSLLDGQDGREVKKEVSDIPFVRVPGHRALVIKRVIALVLRQCARLIYVGPLLIPVVLLSPAPYDGYVLILYVLAMVAFFSTLVAFILWSVVCYGVTRNLEPDVALPEPEDMELATGGDPPMQISGKIVPLAQMPPGSPVYVDAWCLSATPPWRSVRAADFAVVAFGQEPVVVRLESAPIVVAKTEPGTFRDHLEELGEVDRNLIAFGPKVDLGETRGGEVITLRAGDHVEVVAYVRREIPNVGHFELGGITHSLPGEGGAKDAPYRGGPQGSGRLVVSKRGKAVRIRRLGGPSGAASLDRT